MDSFAYQQAPLKGEEMFIPISVGNCLVKGGLRGRAGFASA